MKRFGLLLGLVFVLSGLVGCGDNKSTTPSSFTPPPTGGLSGAGAGPQGKGGPQGPSAPPIQP